MADDKVVYTYVPDMIRYYLDEEIKLPNVETYRCYEPEDFKYVEANIDKLVIKPANESGGYGLLIGPKSTKKQQQETLAQIKADPRNWIAQPTLNLSTVPLLTVLQLKGDMWIFALSSFHQVLTPMSQREASLGLPLLKVPSWSIHHKAVVVKILGLWIRRD